MGSWKEHLDVALANNGETWGDVESHTLSDEELYEDFDDGYGLVEGVPFTLWTREHVYFPAKHDGAEWVASVPRNPNGQPTGHVGGG